MSGETAPPGRLWSVVTYLEMTAEMTVASAFADGPPPSPLNDLGSPTLRHVPQMSAAAYRALYRAVGEPWLWYERLLVAEERLAADIGDERVEIRLIEVGGALAGYSELDRRQPDEIEIAYFGLTPPFLGAGLGRWLMTETLRAAWATAPRRVWLHTCTEDHPRALPFYERTGFRPYKTETAWIDDPRLTGLLPRHVAPHVPLARPLTAAPAGRSTSGP